MCAGPANTPHIVLPVQAAEEKCDKFQSGSCS